MGHLHFITLGERKTSAKIPHLDALGGGSKDIRRHVGVCVSATLADEEVLSSGTTNTTRRKNDFLSSTTGSLVTLHVIPVVRRLGV